MCDMILEHDTESDCTTHAGMLCTVQHTPLRGAHVGAFSRAESHHRCCRIQKEQQNQGPGPAIVKNVKSIMAYGPRPEAVKLGSKCGGSPVPGRPQSNVGQNPTPGAARAPLCQNSRQYGTVPGAPTPLPWLVLGARAALWRACP